MKYNKLGSSDLKVSEVSFGCMSLGTDQAENTRLLHLAHDKGINFFDTADLYQKGANELTVGKAFRGMRDKVLIGTKVGNAWRSDGSGWDWNPTKAYILQAVEQSLVRLQTDYIDLYQLHGGTLEDPIDDTIAAFELLKAQGKIREYGISSIRPNVIREYVQRSGLVSVMMQYSLLDRRPEETVLELLQEHNISVLARGGYAQGRLLGKEPAPYLGYAGEEVQQMAAAVKAVGKRNGNPAAVALGYVLHHPAVAAAVTGIRTEEQLQAALQAVQALPLRAAEINRLKETLQPRLYEQHR